MKSEVWRCVSRNVLRSYSRSGRGAVILSHAVKATNPTQPARHYLRTQRHGTTAWLLCRLLARVKHRPN